MRLYYHYSLYHSHTTTVILLLLLLLLLHRMRGFLVGYNVRATATRLSRWNHHVWPLTLTSRDQGLPWPDGCASYTCVRAHVYVCVRARKRVCVCVFSPQKFDVRRRRRQKVEVTFFVPLAGPRATVDLVVVAVVVSLPPPLGPIKTRSDQPVRMRSVYVLYRRNSKLVFTIYLL